MRLSLTALMGTLLLGLAPANASAPLTGPNMENPMKFRITDGSKISFGGKLLHPGKVVDLDRFVVASFVPAVRKRFEPIAEPGIAEPGIDKPAAAKPKPTDNVEPDEAEPDVDASGSSAVTDADEDGDTEDGAKLAEPPKRAEKREVHEAYAVDVLKLNGGAVANLRTKDDVIDLIKATLAKAGEDGSDATS